MAKARKTRKQRGGYNLGNAGRYIKSIPLKAIKGVCGLGYRLVTGIAGMTCKRNRGPNVSANEGEENTQYEPRQLHNRPRAASPKPR